MKTSQSMALGLELEADGEKTFVEFPPGDDTVFSVGSSVHAGMRLRKPGVAPIEFYVQREDDGLWLVPAYASLELRLDSRRLTERRKLATRALLELRGGTLVIRVHEADELSRARAAQGDDALETREIRRPRRNVDELPSEHDATRVAMPAVAPSHGPLAYSATVAVPVVREDDVPEWQKTVEIPKFLAKTWVGAAKPAKPERDVTVLDREPPKLLPPPRPLARAPAAPATRKLASRVPALLVELGVLSKRRPVAVALGSFVIAIAASLSLVAATRGAKPLRSDASRLVASAPRSASSAEARPTPSGVPSVRVRTQQGAPPSGRDARVPGERRGPADPELAEALDHLVAGRDSQAKAAYARLARRSPDDAVYAVTAQLLERLAACTDPGTRAQLACPKVER
jgi:hypothetical protein